MKKLFLKISQYSQENTILESLFNKVTGRQTYSFIKNKPQHSCFPVNIVKFLTTPILKNI